MQELCQDLLPHVAPGEARGVWLLPWSLRGVGPVQAGGTRVAPLLAVSGCLRHSEEPGTPGGQELSLPSGTVPCLPQRHLFGTRVAQRAVRGRRGPYRSPTPLRPLTGDFSPRDDVRPNKSHCLVFHLLRFRLLSLQELEAVGGLSRAWTVPAIKMTSGTAFGSLRDFAWTV